jgi:hypothetical protein
MNPHQPKTKMDTRLATSPTVSPGWYTNSVTRLVSLRQNRLRRLTF